MPPRTRKRKQQLDDEERGVSGQAARSRLPEAARHSRYQLLVAAVLAFGVGVLNTPWAASHDDFATDSSRLTHVMVRGLLPIMHLQGSTATEWPAMDTSIANNSSHLTPDLLADYMARVRVHALSDTTNFPWGDAAVWETRARDLSLAVLSRLGLRHSGWMEESPASLSKTRSGIQNLLAHMTIFEQCPHQEGSMLGNLVDALREASFLPSDEKLDHGNIYRYLPKTWLKFAYHMNLLLTPMGVGTILCHDRGTAAGCVRWGSYRAATFSATGMRKPIHLPPPTPTPSSSCDCKYTRQLITCMAVHAPQNLLLKLTHTMRA